MIENNLKLKYCLRKLSLCTKIHFILQFLLSFKMYSHKICFTSQEHNSRYLPFTLVLCVEVYVVISPFAESSCFYSFF